jgi:hypothetical protein
MTKPTTTNQQKSIGPTQSANGDSIQSTIINARNQPKVHELNDPNDKIKIALKYIFGLTGLKAENLPNDEQKLILIEFIRSEFKNWTCDEFVNAFRLLVAGHLDFDGNHYQNFNAMYFSNVMAAYKTKKIDVLKFIQQPEPIKQIDENERRKMQIQFIQDCILKPFKYYKRTGNLTFGITPSKIIYEYLTDDFKLLNLSTAEKNAIHDQAIETVKSNWATTRLNLTRENRTKQSSINTNGFEKTFAFEIKNECYRISVIQFFERLDFDFEQTVNNYIKNL